MWSVCDILSSVIGQPSSSDDAILIASCFSQHDRARVCLQVLITLTFNGCAANRFLLYFFYFEKQIIAWNRARLEL